MIVNEIFAILDALLKSGYEVLGSAIIIEVLESIYEVCVLRKMKVLACLALLAHLAIAAVLESANERNHLLVTAAYDILIHLWIITKL